MNFDAIETRLQQEEQASPVASRADLEQRYEARRVLSEDLHALRTQLDALSSHYRRLPKLPAWPHITWAQSMLTLPGLVICVIDTTGINKDSDIIRAVLFDTQGEVVFDRIVQPLRQPGQANTTYTGLTTAHLSNASPLAEIWSELQAELLDRYVLAYNWEWLIARIRENARAYGLPPLTMTGECLMERASRYYSVSTSLKLADICARIGHSLPHAATASERAIGQLAFLQAMAQGITTVPTDTVATEDDPLDDLDSHPF